MNQLRRERKKRRKLDRQNKYKTEKHLKELKKCQIKKQTDNKSLIWE